MNVTISDNKRVLHKNVIKKMIRNSRELTIAVAFLKISGLKIIRKEIEVLVDSNIKITFIAGLNFYQTEPDALFELLTFTKKNKNINLYICANKNKTFHPKLYLSEKNKTFVAVIGSANMTNGGFSDNFELSSIIEGDLTESVFSDLKHYINDLVTQSEEANHLILSQYKNKFDIYNKKLKQAKKDIEQEINQKFVMNIKKLNKFIKEYLADKKEMANWQKRVNDYKEAKKTLDIMAKNNFSSKKEFMESYNVLVGGAGYKKLWHSGSIFRSKNKVAKKYKSFCLVVSQIKNDIALKKEPSEIFNNALNLSKKIDGLGVNILTEIMNTYNPKRCSVLNKNPLESLNEIGFQKFKSQQYFNSNDYQVFNEIMIDILNKCKFENLGQVDHFCNYIYWKYVKHNHANAADAKSRATD